MVYCRTLPDLTFPVTEWDLGTRLVTLLTAWKACFPHNGIPYSIKTDNGTQFISEEIESFFTDNADIDHRTSRRDKTAAFQKSSELNKQKEKSCGSRSC